jgi:hypothetical protein
MGAPTLLVGLLGVLSPALAQAQPGIDFARELYNQGRYDQAIVAAARLRAGPATTDTANLVLGRAHLERYRKTADRADLVAGREALRDIRPSQLGSRDRLDYLIGLGESLYLDESYGPAAELFGSALDRSGEMGPRAFDRLFDWWATALDRQAQAGESDGWDAVYTTIRNRAAADLARVPGSASATYWLVVAYRSLGDSGHAWDAAVAGWVRAPLAEDQGASLRADLDRLVLQAIIPERAREGGASDRDRERVAASLREAWEAVKQDWTQKR